MDAAKLSGTAPIILLKVHLMGIAAILAAFTGNALAATLFLTTVLLALAASAYGQPISKETLGPKMYLI